MYRRDGDQVQFLIAHITDKFVSEMSLQLLIEHLGQVIGAVLQGLCPTLKCGPETSDLLDVSYGFLQSLQVHGGTVPYVFGQDHLHIVSISLLTGPVI